MMDVGRHPNVELMSFSEVESVSGFVGNFHVTVRKKAREAIRELVTAVRSTPEAQWQATITTGIMRTPQIVSYITAATIRLALLEAGADAPLAQKIIDAVNATGIVPDSIPRG